MQINAFVIIVVVIDHCKLDYPCRQPHSSFTNSSNITDACLLISDAGPLCLRSVVPQPFH